MTQQMTLAAMMLAWRESWGRPGGQTTPSPGDTTVSLLVAFIAAQRGTRAAGSKSDNLESRSGCWTCRCLAGEKERRAGQRRGSWLLRASLVAVGCCRQGWRVMVVVVVVVVWCVDVDGDDWGLDWVGRSWGSGARGGSSNWAGSLAGPVMPRLEMPFQETPKVRGRQDGSQCNGWIHGRGAKSLGEWLGLVATVCRWHRQSGWMVDGWMDDSSHPRQASRACCPGPWQPAEAAAAAAAGSSSPRPGQLSFCCGADCSLHIPTQTLATARRVGNWNAGERRRAGGEGRDGMGMDWRMRESLHSALQATTHWKWTA